MFSTTFAPYVATRHKSVLARIATVVLQWQTRSEQRRALAELDDRLLRDVGLDRASAKIEADKPFWQE